MHRGDGYSKQLRGLYQSMKLSGMSQDTDLAIFVKPGGEVNMPDDCKELPADLSYKVPMSGPGRCWYRRVAPLKDTDPAYYFRYPYMVSVAILVQPEAAFLRQYDLMLRTDGDCFVTPRLAQWYPEDFQASELRHEISLEYPCS